MIRTLFIISLLCCLFGALEAQASVGVGAYVAFPKAVNTSKSLPSGLALGVHTVQPITKGWLGFTEVGVITPTAKMNLQPQLIAGTIKKISNGFLLGLTGLARLAPKNDTYALGGAIVPVFSISKNLKVATPVAYISYAGGVSLVSVSLRLNFQIL